MPFKGLYILSHFFYLLLYYLIPYRKKIIIQNIDRSFPDKSENEKKAIVKGFYRNLSNIFVEAFKGFTMSKKSLVKRYYFLNPEVMDNLYVNGQDVLAVGSHYANWEWGILAAPLQLKHKIHAFYTTLSNRHIDTYMRRNRMKNGTNLVPTTNVRGVFNAKNDSPVCYFFGADQSPANTRGVHWMNFLNQDTACLKGPEIFARKNGLPVVYFDVQRIKRGFYTVSLKIIESDSKNTNTGEITEKYMRTLEDIVENKPEDYLWSHRRWKHQRVKDN